MQPLTSDTQHLSNGGVKKKGRDSSSDRNKTTRNPRWITQEMLILVNAKRVVENRVRKGRRSCPELATYQTEPKWDSISSYCRQHGVNRGPDQCRKRWGNMLCDFRKIKAWESTNDKEESFWLMRNELRKARKLPSFFNREVYDALDGELLPVEAVPLAFITANTKIDNSGADSAGAEEEDNEEGTQESGPCASLEEEYLVDPEQLAQDEIGTSSEKENVENGSPRNMHTSLSPTPGSIRKENPANRTRTDSICSNGCKKRRLSCQGQDSNDESQLIKILERTSNMLHLQLEVQNQNTELDRKQRKEWNDSLFHVLNKLTDAVIKIANKL